MTDSNLDYEREMNRAYQRAVDERSAVRVQGVDSRKLAADWGPLLGRVSLVPSTCDDQEFYVGPMPALLPNGVRVVSWVAPASAAFFTGTASWEGQKIRVKRRFKTNSSEIQSYADQWIVPDNQAPFPVSRRAIARPPGSIDRALMRSRGAPPATPVDRSAPDVVEQPNSKLAALAWLHERKLANRPQERKPTNKAPAEDSQGSRTNAGRRRIATRPAGPPGGPPPLSPTESSTISVPHAAITAGVQPRRDLVADAMNEPRRAHLPSVLATMSPEQFAAVTAAPTTSTVVSGHPGTGKTIIATHRLAWLTHPDRDGSLDYVLLVGPTDAWAKSVLPSVDELTVPNRRQVLSLPGLMRFVLGTKRVGKHRPDQHEDTSQELVTALERYTSGISSGKLSEVYASIRDVGFADESTDLRHWRRALPPTLDLAEDTEQLRPLLAYLSIRVGTFSKFTHIIVDEAQDLRPIDWAILRLINAGSWTIVGDMNQRRTLFSINSWSAIGELIGATLAETSIQQGYRSTEAIMSFASALLEAAKGARLPSVLGDGEPPRIVDARATGRSVDEAALREALRLRGQLRPDATVAIITTDPKSLQRAAERSSWRRAGATAGVGSYQKADERGVTQSVLLLSPERARGLEFDAVVVIEPAAFGAARSQIRMPGQYRTLYTSLTRANQRLTVVHSRPLPAPLRTAISIR